MPVLCLSVFTDVSTNFKLSLYTLGPNAPFFFKIASSSSLISWSISAPLDGLFPCALAGSVASSFSLCVSMESSELSFSR
jgi:hypothetical protein